MLPTEMSEQGDKCTQPLKGGGGGREDNERGAKREDCIRKKDKLNKHAEKEIIKKGG